MAKPKRKKRKPSGGRPAPTVDPNAILNEADEIREKLAPGHGHICSETAGLAVTFKQILTASMLRTKHGSG